MIRHGREEEREGQNQDSVSVTSHMDPLTELKKKGRLRDRVEDFEGTRRVL